MTKLAISQITKEYKKKQLAPNIYATEYLACRDGNQYIDSQFLYNNADTAVITTKFCIRKNGVRQCLYAAYDKPYVNHEIDSSNRFRLCSASEDRIVGFANIGEIYTTVTTITAGVATCAVYNSLGEQIAITDNVTVPTHTYPLLIFRDYRTNIFNSQFLQLYELSIEVNSELFRHFVPAISNKNVPGLFDLVTNTLFVNNGTESLVSGPILYEETDSEVEQIHAIKQYHFYKNSAQVIPFKPERRYPNLSYNKTSHKLTDLGHLIVPIGSPNLVITKLMPNTWRDFEIQLKINLAQYGQLMTWYHEGTYYRMYDMYIYSASGFRFATRHAPGNSWDNREYTVYTNLNKWYTIKITKVKSRYTCYYSEDDGETWTQQFAFDFTWTDAWSGYPYISIFEGCKGILDLKKCYIKYNDFYFWRGLDLIQCKEAEATEFSVPHKKYYVIRSNYGN